jgi:alkanesulfonate monooxygenase SsuD/methylene tetrahydromethanopterin reductase-like flavin-dependent oxidoreductase (luciferase family)
VLQQPYSMIAASVLAAETDAEAQRLALPGALQFLRLRQGNPGLVPTPEEAAAYPYSAQEQAFVDDRLGGQVIGSPDTVRDGVRALVERTAVDELMVVTSAHAGPDRLRSYELLAGVFAPAGTMAG